MILAIDIGNTHTTLGFFRERKLTFQSRLKSDLKLSRSALASQLRKILKQKRISFDMIDGAVISSVVPDLTKTYSAILKQQIHTPPLIIRGSLDTGLTILYNQPKSLGADRICNAVAGFHLYGGPTIIIDLGTATTFDVVSKKSEYLGGAIAPGIRTAAEALHARTAQLPRIQLTFPTNVIAKNTLRGIQSGVMFGALDAMEGIVRRIKKVTGQSSVVVLTGGLSKIISRHTSIAHALEPSLVLRGAMLIYERHIGQIKI